jgi:hypothetical protein
VPGSSRPLPGLSPAQYCALVGAEARAGGPLLRIVFPVLESGLREAPGFRIERLAPEETARRWLEDGLLARGRLSPWLAPQPGRARAQIERSVAEWAERIPGYACLLGPDPYGSPALWKALQETPAAHPAAPAR